MYYEPVIGLEVHIQLNTDTKIFCSCSTLFGAVPNSQVCPVCLGMPGSLPVLNRKVMEYAVRLSLATGCKINNTSILARKNYFYPDLPKSYQISQFEEPFAEHGELVVKIEGQPSRRIGITRIHMEEDAGKSLHAESFVGKDESLVDVNRCGVPLLEVVSDPDFRTPQEAYEYLVHLRQIVVYLGICDGNMEEGSLRCDANVSLRPIGTTTLGTKTELKNMNSFRAVEKALEYEIHRQEMILENGGVIEQQTLLWDANRNVAESMRTKEYSHDYRYFPDPDLAPISMTAGDIEQVRANIPELPEAKRERFMRQFSLPEYDAQVLTESPKVAEYFEQTALRVKDKKAASNWIMGNLLRSLKERNEHLHQLKLTPAFLAELLTLIEQGTISGSSAKEVFEECLDSGKSPTLIVEEKGLLQISDLDAIEQIVSSIIEKNPRDVQDYLNGNEKVLGFFIGQIMRATQGKANPKLVNSILRKKLALLSK
ncbi:MAG: Asp-tRNA(Asn)/Glu-tRNA(Gln) amidotransferase subunit GatB [Calditrichaeota bacterium]|nr:MAG: Asp-tRNA(Asn)/Glu-tRNA(Gln) amidotransferase subunit GatB [Calditrichota bacterium]